MKNKLIMLFLFFTVNSCSDLFDNFQAIKIRVIFESNGGTGTMENQIFTDGIRQKLSANVFTYSGYIFAGWNTKPDGSGKSYRDEEDVSFTIEPESLYAEESMLTLYACWEKIILPDTQIKPEYFIVPDIDRLELYNIANKGTAGIELANNVILEDNFDQIADDKGNVYFSYKDCTNSKIVIARYDGKDVSVFLEHNNTTSRMRLAYDNSKLYLLMENTIFNITNGDLKKEYTHEDSIDVTAFTVSKENIYIACQYCDYESYKNINKIIKIDSDGNCEDVYNATNEHNFFISDMQIIDDVFYFLSVECVDFSYFYGYEYWRGALIKYNSCGIKKIALSSSNFGTETTFYSPLRFFAKREDELLIMDDGITNEDGEIKQKNRLAVFDFDSELVNFSDMTEQLLYTFEGSL